MTLKRVVAQEIITYRDLSDLGLQFTLWIPTHPFIILAILVHQNQTIITVYLVLVNRFFSPGYISWQGRCCCQNASSFRTFLLHASSQVSGCPCPVPSCTDCDLDKEDDLDSSTSEIDESVEKSSSQHRRESVELSSLHQRLHGAKPDDKDFTLRRSFAPQGLKKELTRPKTTTGANLYTKSSGYNRSIGFNEPIRTFSRSFSAYGAIQPRRPGTARPGSVSARPHSSAPQTGTEFSSGDFSLPVVTRRRGKRTHPLERGSASRIKTKISVEDFNLLHK